MTSIVVLEHFQPELVRHYFGRERSNRVTTSIAYAVASSSTSRCHTKRTWVAPAGYPRTPAASASAASSPGAQPAEIGVEHEDVRLDGLRVHGAGRHLGERRRRPPRPGMVIGQPPDVLVQGIQPGRGEDADLAHAAPVPLAPHPRLGHGVRRPDENRAHRCAKPLAQAHRHGVELTPVVGQGHPARDVRVPQPGTVQVQPDAARARPGTQGPDGLEGLHRATPEVVRVLDHDERGAHLVGLHPGHRQLQRLTGVEQPAWGRPGAGGDPREHCRGAQLRADHVGDLVADQLLPGPHVQAQGQLVGHRPGGGEEPGLVTEQPGDALLQLAHGRVLPEDVVTDLRGGHCGTHPRAGAREGVRQQVGPQRRGQRRHGSPCCSPSISAIRNASSRLCWWLSRGSHSVS